MTTATTTPAKPRVLVVDDEPDLVDVVRDVVGKSIDCRILVARNVKEARNILATTTVELVVIDVNLPDGDGMSLIPNLRRDQPLASAIVITGAPSVDGAINALRQGALDFVPKPFTAEHLLERVKRALDRQSVVVRNEKRLAKLKDAVRRLNEARKLVTRKVDLLCNDLVTAYGELSRQLEGVRTQEGFRKYISQARDLEQLLCHGMDWILRQLGYCNVAIWLAAEEEDFQLGAYMKYTIAGENDLIEAMKSGLVRRVVRDSAIHLSDEQIQQCLTPQELDYLADQTVMGVNCTYLGESLATIVIFRDNNQPFSEEDFDTLKTISPIFAVALASMVRHTQHNADASSEDSPFYDGDSDLGHYADGDEPGPDAKKKKRRDADHDADWWKRGEPPPF